MLDANVKVCGRPLPISKRPPLSVITLAASGDGCFQANTPSGSRRKPPSKEREVLSQTSCACGWSSTSSSATERAGVARRFSVFWLSRTSRKASSLSLCRLRLSSRSRSTFSNAAVPAVLLKLSRSASVVSCKSSEPPATDIPSVKVRTPPVEESVKPGLREGDNPRTVRSASCVASPCWDTDELLSPESPEALPLSPWPSGGASSVRSVVAEPSVRVNSAKSTAPTTKPSLRVTVASSSSLSFVRLSVCTCSKGSTPPSSNVPPERSRLAVPASSAASRCICNVPGTARSPPSLSVDPWALTVPETAPPCWNSRVPPVESSRLRMSAGLASVRLPRLVCRVLLSSVKTF